MWTIIGSAAGVFALGLAAWQVRLQLLERRERNIKSIRGDAEVRVDGLPVAVPLGRLPSDVRGREAVLHDMRSLLARHSRPSSRTWVLAGMGGVGKSTIALSLAEAAQKQGWQVWWVTALNSMSMTGGMVEILHQLGAPLSVTQAVSEGAPTASARAWQFLNGSHSAGRHWLLVFDNADNPEVLAAGSSSPANYTGWLRPDPSGALIVTSRIVDPRIWGPRVTLRLLRPLERAAAARVLADLAPKIADPTGMQADELAKRLGGLPLALHLAGTYLASPFTRWRTFTEYREALDSAGFPQVLAEMDDAGSDARDTIQRTWELSLEGLAADGRPQARPMLSLLSCYAPATPIPTTLLDPVQLGSLFSEVYPSQAATIAAKKEDERRQVREALSGLAAIGLLQIDGVMTNSGTVTIHPVVADVDRSHLLADTQSTRSAIGRVAVELLHKCATGLDPMRAQDWSSWRQIAPHLTALLEWLAPYLEDAAIINLLNAGNPASDALWRCGDLVGAESLARLCVTAGIRLGNDEPASLAARYQLATTIAFIGRYAQGEHVKDELDETAGISIEPGLSTRWLVRYQESEKILREVLTGQQRSVGPDHPDTLTTRYRLAWVMGLEGQHTEAERMFRELLPDRRRVFGEDDIATTATRHRIAWALVLQRQYAQAEEIFRQLLPDEQRVLGEEHPDTLTTRHRLAWVVGLQGHFAEAEQMHRGLLPDERRVLGNEHPDTLTTRHRLAYVIARQGRHAEAMKMFAELLPDQQRVLGDSHPDTLSTKYQLSRKSSHR
jgi:tetratricopeptide (TPR) repeat protein